MSAQEPRLIFGTAALVLVAPLSPAFIPATGMEYVAALLGLGGLWLIRAVAHQVDSASSWLDAVIEGAQLGLGLLAAGMLVMATLHGISGLLHITVVGAIPFAAIGGGIGMVSVGFGKPLAKRGQWPRATLGALFIISFAVAGMAARDWMGDGPDAIALTGAIILAALAASYGMETLWQQRALPPDLRAARFAHSLILGMIVSLGPDRSIIGAWLTGLAAAILVDAVLTLRDRRGR